jgi:hypothetical protein
VLPTFQSFSALLPISPYASDFFITRLFAATVFPLIEPPKTTKLECGDDVGSCKGAGFGGNQTHTDEYVN